jgi:hypothetical protein
VHVETNIAFSDIQLFRQFVIGVYVQLAFAGFQIFVNRRAILSRLEVETASNSFHLSMSPSSVLAGGIWSVLHG